MGFHEKWTTILNHMNGLSFLPPSLPSSLPSLFMHELAIRSCFSGEGRFDAVGKCVSVSKGEGERKEGGSEGGGDISKVICMYVKKPMPQFCSEEDSLQYCEFVTDRDRHAGIPKEAIHVGLSGHASVSVFCARLLEIGIFTTLLAKLLVKLVYQ